LIFKTIQRGKNLRGGNPVAEILSNLPEVLQLPCGRAFITRQPSSKASYPLRGPARPSTALPSPTEPKPKTAL